MPRTVNVNYVTKEVKILLHDSETESLAAATAIAAAESAQEAKDVVVDNLQDSLDAIDAKTETEKTELDDYTETKKTEIETLGQGYVDSASQKADEANTILAAIRDEYGYPFTAATAAAMTDPSKIYIYTGSEAGYTNGNWYYYDGTAWVSGGVYNSTAFETDKTLTVSGSAADAKVTGDRLNSLAIKLDPIAVYEGKQARATGLVDVSGSTVYQYAIPSIYSKIHIVSYFYGNARIVFTDYATPQNFTTADYKIFPTTGYKTLTDVSETLETDGYQYVYVSFWNATGKYCNVTYLTLDVINDNAEGVSVNAKNILETNARIDNIENIKQYPYTISFEMGSIIIYSQTGELMYQDSTTRIRTPEGENVHLPVGAVVKLSDYTSHRFYLYRFNADDSFTALGWKQADFSIPTDADYALLISAVPEATVDKVSDLADLMTIYLPAEEEEQDDNIPEYWWSEINTSMQTIQSNELLAGNRIFEFVFLTDTHWLHNAKKSPAIVEYLSNRLHINQVFGGDVVTSSYADKSNAISEIRDFYNSFQNPIISVLGNHDFNPNNDTTQWLTMPECYALMLRQQEDVKGMDTFASPYYWKLDNISQKVRLIGFRCDAVSVVSSDTLNQVTSMITELDSSWTVVLLTHGFWKATPIGAEPEIAPNVQTVINSLLPVVESASASVPLWVVGHSHKDMSHIINSSTKNILVVGCNCDAYAESAVWGGETMTQGTSTEQAITCIQLDLTNDIVHAVRIGAGTDRTFNL